MQGGTFSKNGKAGEALTYIAGFVISLIMLILFIGGLLRYLFEYFKSKSFKSRTSTPRVPHCLLGNLCAPKLVEWNFPAPHFRVYTKEYTLETFNNKGRVSEKKHKIGKKIKKILEELFDGFIDAELYPPSTCIVSIPRKNFKSGPMPGTFVPIHGGPPDSHFEFQMIGDNRIQVAYYVVDGVDYVAGFCIYIETPYQETHHYNASVIRKLMVQGPEYWSKWNHQEEKMEIVKKVDLNYMLITKNRYGVEKNWILEEDKRCFRYIGTCPKSDYKAYDDGDPKNQLSVKMCNLEKKLVVIAKENGKNCHANWNKETKKLEMFDCPSCEPNQEAPPPSYSSIIEKV